MTLNPGLEGHAIFHADPVQASSWLAAFVGLAFFLHQVILRGPEESWLQAEERALVCGQCWL